VHAVYVIVEPFVVMRVENWRSEHENDFSESATQADTRSVCIICTAVGLYRYCASAWYNRPQGYLFRYWRWCLQCTYNPYIILWHVCTINVCVILPYVRFTK